MRTTNMAPTFDVLARRALACLVLAGALPAAAARIPQPVSPGAQSAGVVAEARCPTFSWAGVPGARGYELAVFRVSDAPGAQPVLVTRASVPGDARAFTPPVGQCLERGQRYAWSVAVAADAPDWSTPFLFEIEPAPSLEEVEQAIATLQRYREHQAADEPPSPAPAIAAADAPEPPGGRSSRALLRTRERPTPFADRPLPEALTSPTSGVVRVASAATPTLGSPSLRVSANVALGASSNLFKYDAASTSDVVFLWDDATGNTALGRNALSSASGTAARNTALGREALRNTTGGLNPQGSLNTAVGDRALFSNTTGYRNTASGERALYANTTARGNTASGAEALLLNTTGSNNTASGLAALRANTTGSSNTALGYSAGDLNTTGSNSIFINNNGAPGDTATIKIGTQGTQLSTFIAGISGQPPGPTPAAVLIGTNGQLGTTVSSRRFKQDIQGLEPAIAERLLELQPVAFRYRDHVAADPDTPREFGLIAEDVAEVFPELVVYDEEGKPETVKYHLLSSLLLGELQKQQGELDDLRAKHQADLDRLTARLEALESRSPRDTRSRDSDHERSRR